jgi:hypothetical protein
MFESGNRRNRAEFGQHSGRKATHKRPQRLCIVERREVFIDSMIVFVEYNRSVQMKQFWGHSSELIKTTGFK